MRFLGFLASFLVALIATVPVHGFNKPINRAGAAYVVDCDQGQTIAAILTAIANGPSGGRATIDIYGTCKENVLIQGLDRVTLAGHNGASIVDQSNGAADTVGIDFSSLITVQGLTVIGGQSGINCAGTSTCHVENNIVQNAAFDGLHVARSNAQSVNNTYQNNVRGVGIANGATLGSSGDIVTGNSGDGVGVIGATLVAQYGTIQNNGANGIRARNNATLRFTDLTITNNGTNGVRLDSAATLAWDDDQGSTITGNSGYGMRLGDQVNTVFSGADNVSGNQGQPDVNCVGIYWVARNVETVGGTTNCVQSVKEKK
jgi:hypothetical protein